MKRPKDPVIDRLIFLLRIFVFIESPLNRFDICRTVVDCNLLDPTIMDMNDTVRNLTNGSIMGHNNHCCTLNARHVLQYFQYMLACLIV